MFKNIKLHYILKMKFICLLFLIIFSGCTSIDENIKVSITDEKIVEVAIRESDYNPKDISIEKGTTIIWTNYDSQGHTVTIDGLLDSKTINKGKTFSYSFNDIGEYEYYCKIHPDMEGTIIVQ